MKLIQAQKAAKTNIFPDYWTLLYGRRLSDIMIKTLTGTLPLTFTTSETALRSWIIYGNDFQQEESKGTRLPLSFYTDEDKLRDWTIYGNNTQHNYSAEGTLPLTFTTQTAGAASDWSISGNDKVGKNLLDIESATVSPHTTIGSVNNSTGSIEVTAESNYTYRSANIILTDILEVGKVYTITLIKNNVTPSEQLANATLRRVDTNTIVASTGSAAFEAAGDKTFSYTHTQERAEQGIYFSLLVTGNSTTGGTLSVSNLMIREATTSATFEPYQIGVGQRTKNLFNATIEQGGINSGAEYNSNTRIRTTFMPNMLDAGTYTLNASGVNNVVTNYFDDNKTYTGGVTTWRTLPLIFNISKRCYVRFAFRASDSHDITPSDISNIMLVEGSTAPESFIPYGYKIPLTVSQTGQTDKTVDIFIGDSPLTEGETVSKTSTGVDIELFEGENTVSTTLYNKPETSITYTDYIGVGEYVNGQWQIPLTVSDGTNTTSVTIPIDAPLTASDTATKTSTGVDIATYVGTNTISTTLENKPTMLVYYGYKGVGEHSGDDTWELYFITQANGNQQLTKITMDKPLRAGETLTSEQAGVAMPTYANAENTLSLYPSAAGYGNPEMTITYKGD